MGGAYTLYVHGCPLFRNAADLGYLVRIHPSSRIGRTARLGGHHLYHRCACLHSPTVRTAEEKDAHGLVLERCKERRLSVFSSIDGLIIPVACFFVPHCISRRGFPASLMMS